MINPSPVNSKSTPYSTSSSAGLPRTLAAPTSSGKKKVRWGRFLGLGFATLVAASATYLFAQFSSLKNNVIVAHEGETNAILKNAQPEKLDPTLFKKAGDGRFNIVIIGMGGAGHPGGMLTDSIQVMSVDTLNKKASLTSVPRDLYVPLSGSGNGKINTAYQLGEENAKGQGGYQVRQTVGNVLGITISNFVLMDFTAVKQLVDAMGGIDVEVPKAINDPLFPDDAVKGYSPFYIEAGTQHMNGATALKYARSRETTSDFDRSARQQLIIAALKKKALSLGTLSNPAKVSALTDALGQHIKTDLQPDEIKAFISIYRDVSAENSSSAVLDTSEKLGLLTSTTSPTTGYISYPQLGYGKFDDIQSWFQKNNPDPLLAKESATITVVAGTNSTAKQVQAMVDTLNDYGYKASVGTATTSKLRSTTKTAVYDATKNKKPFSRNYLASQFDTSAQDGNPLSSGSDFEIIYVPKK